MPSVVVIMPTDLYDEIQAHFRTMEDVRDPYFCPDCVVEKKASMIKSMQSSRSSSSSSLNKLNKPSRNPWKLGRRSQDDDDDMYSISPTSSDSHSPKSRSSKRRFKAKVPSMLKFW